MENDSQFIVQGLLNASTQVGAGTLGTVTAKSRTSTGSTVQTTFVFSSGSVAANDLIVNSTHSSYAFVSRLISAGNWLMSQPLSPIAIPMTLNPASGGTAEVDTWTAGDAVTIYNPTALNIVQFDPSSADVPIEGANGPVSPGTLYHLSVFEPQNYFNFAMDPLVLGSNSSVVEASIQRVAQWGPVASWFFGANATAANADLIGGAVTTSTNVYDSGRVWIIGGVIGESATPIACAAGQWHGAFLDGDFTIGSNCSDVFSSGGQFGRVFLDTSAIFEMQDGGQEFVEPFNGGTPIIYGPGTLDVSATTRVVYPSGASNAAATFKVGTFEFNAQTKCCSTFPGSSTVTCNLACSAAEADSVLGATSGCLGVLNGGNICNFGLPIP
jgi:hypothetical protein